MKNHPYLCPTDACAIGMPPCDTQNTQKSVFVRPGKRKDYSNGV